MKEEIIEYDKRTLDEIRRIMLSTIRVAQQQGHEGITVGDFLTGTLLVAPPLTKKLYGLLEGADWIPEKVSKNKEEKRAPEINIFETGKI